MNFQRTNVSQMPHAKRAALWLGLLLCTLSFLCTGDLRCQNITGTILGTVTDPSGAVVPGATVQLTNTDTGLVRKTTTDPAGHYFAPSLSLGPYSVSVSQAGFKEVVKSGMVLTVDASLEVDLQLEVGAVTQEVTVTAAASLVSTTSGAVGTTIGVNTVETLPLATRSFTDLIGLSAGVTSGSPGDLLQEGANPAYPWGGDAYNFAGSRDQNSSYYADGANVDDPVNGSLDYSPPLDAIQEFKLVQNDYSAQFGRAAGGVVNVILKSGTDQFHGDAFEFARNAAISGRNFFASGVPPFVYNQFGGTLGGPIKKDKLFFFMDYQGTRSRTGTTYVTSLPTAAQRGGDLSSISSPLYNPYDVTGTTSNGLPIRAPFTGNIIPPNMINSSAAALLAAMPAPNLPGIVNNFTISPSVAINFDQADGKLTYNLPHNATFFGRWSIGDDVEHNPPVLGPTLGGDPGLAEILTLRSQQIALGFVVPISSTEVNEIHAGYTRKTLLEEPYASAVNADAAYGIMPGLNSPPGYGANGLSWISVGGYADVGASPYIPDGGSWDIYNVADDFSLTRGRNAFKMGFDLIKDENNYFVANCGRGCLGFSAGFSAQPGVTGTGYSLADFLLGTEDGFSRQTLLDGEIWGMRNTEVGFYFQDAVTVTNRLHAEVGLRWDVNTPLHEAHNRLGNYDPTTNTILIAGVNTTPTVGLLTDWHAFAPRFGFSYALTQDKKTVLRGGAGIFTFPAFTSVGNGPRLTYNAPFAINQSPSIDNTAAVPTYTLNTPMPPLTTPQPVVNPTGGVYMYSRHFPDSFANEINVDLQREFGNNWMVDVGWVGSKAGDLVNTYNLNQAIPGPGPLVSRYPVSQTASGITYTAPVGNSTYSGLTVQLQKRMSEGLTFLAAYTYSRSTDLMPSTDIGSASNDGGPQYAQDLAAERGVSDFNQPQRFTFSYSYELPFGKGRKFLTAASKPVDAILGGWQLAGIMQYWAGNPFSVNIGHNPSNSNSAYLRPDRICNGAVSNPTPREWYNPACFVDPALYTFGNAGRDILTGPGYEDWDTSLFKNFKVTEGKQLQLRLETFNTFNHVNWGFPSATVDEPGAGVISSAKSPRVVQIAAKFIF